MQILHIIKEFNCKVFLTPGNGQEIFYLVANAERVKPSYGWGNALPGWDAIVCMHEPTKFPSVPEVDIHPCLESMLISSKKRFPMLSTCGHQSHSPKYEITADEENHKS